MRLQAAGLGKWGTGRAVRQPTEGGSSKEPTALSEQSRPWELEASHSEETGTLERDGEVLRAKVTSVLSPSDQRLPA